MENLIHWKINYMYLSSNFEKTRNTNKPSEEKKPKISENKF